MTGGALLHVAVDMVYLAGLHRAVVAHDICWATEPPISRLRTEAGSPKLRPRAPDSGDLAPARHVEGLTAAATQRQGCGHDVTVDVAQRSDDSAA